MKEDYKELVEYLDAKFNVIDEGFSQVKVDIKDLKEGFDSLQKSVDAYAVKADAFFQEMVMLSHKVDRHEKWLLQIAEKLGIKLEY